MTKEEIAKLTLEDVDTIFGPAIPEPGMGDRDSAGVLFENIVDRSDPRLNPNNLTREDEEAIIEHVMSNLIGGLTIEELSIEDEDRYIAASGDTRKITIKGTPGAKFTVAVKDGSDCSIMEEELEHIEIPDIGHYVFEQKFPSVASDKKVEFYEIKLTPQATVKYNYTEDLKVYQYPAKTISFIPLEGNIPFHVYSEQVLSDGRDAARFFQVKGFPSNSTGEREETWTTTVSESAEYGGEDAGGKYYVKSLDFNEAITKSTAIKKVVHKPNGGSIDKTINLKPLATGVRDGNASGDLKVGMIFRGNVEKIKKVFKSLEVPDCKRKTNRFELESTTDLFEGMSVRINNIVAAEVLSIDCVKNITISKKLTIRSGDKVKFTYTTGGRVESVVTQLNQEGNACVTIGREVYMPNGMELNFDDDRSVVKGRITAAGSGTDQVVLTKYLTIKSIGTRDVIYQFDKSKVITRKPNAKNFNVETLDNTPVIINLSAGDFDSNKLTKRHTITKNGSHGAATWTAGVNGEGGTQYPYITYTPIKGFLGEDVIKYRVTHDGTSSLVDDDTAANPMSDEKTIRITVK